MYIEFNIVSFPVPINTIVRGSTTEEEQGNNNNGGNY